LNPFVKAIAPRGLYWSVPADKKKIYLTFDDGPTPELTQSILKILREFEAKATFFCVGNNASDHPEIFKDIKLRGHSVGNHTHHHLKGWKTPIKEYLDDIEMCGSFVDSSLFRPPYGKITPLQIKRLRDRYRIIMWNVLSRDFDQRIGFRECLNRCKKATRPGAIVVFHDNVKASGNMLYTLPRYLEYFVNQGYDFDPLTADLFTG